MPKSPLLEIQKKMGARTAEVDGWEQAVAFTNVGDEVRSVRHTAGLFDASSRGTVLLEGEDRIEFLNNLTTNNIKQMQPGMWCWTYILDAKGKVQADLRVLRSGDKLLLDIPIDLTEKVVAILDRYLIMEDVQICDATAEWALLLLQGPNAPAALKTFFADEIPDADNRACFELEAGGIPFIVFCIDCTGAGGYGLLVHVENSGEAWRNLLNVDGVTAAGTEAAEILRIEAGIPRTGKDLTGQNIPIEAGVFDAISYTKGCYLGQEVIARLHAHGDNVAQKLVGLKVEAELPPLPGDPLIEGGKRVGKVTSSTLSPSLGYPIALAMVKRGFNDAGRELLCSSGRGDMPVHVVETPFV